MKKELQELAHEDEEKLVKELASLRVELTPEADFESRFLVDFHNRLAESEVTSKTKLPFFVRVKAAITSPYGRSWIMGACAAVVVGFLVGGLLMVPEEGNVSVVVEEFHSSGMGPVSLRCDNVSELENAGFQEGHGCAEVDVCAVNTVADEAAADNEAAADEDKTEDTEVQDGE